MATHADNRLDKFVESNLLQNIYAREEQTESVRASKEKRQNIKVSIIVSKGENDKKKTITRLRAWARTRISTYFGIRNSV